MTEHAPIADAFQNVLLIEDDLFFAGRLSSVLKHLGWRVTTVRSPEKALAFLAGRDAAARPVLALLNLATPALGGLPLVRQMKETDPALRMIAYLSHVKIAAVRDEARAAGVDRLCPNSVVFQRLPLLIEKTRETRTFAVEEETEDGTETAAAVTEASALSNEERG
jgi:DNA-binding NtrC family response regulator